MGVPLKMATCSSKFEDGMKQESLLKLFLTTTIISPLQVFDSEKIQTKDSSFSLASLERYRQAEGSF